MLYNLFMSVENGGAPLELVELARGIQEPEDSVAYVRSQADFLFAITDLVSNLSTVREPEEVRHNFTYFRRDLGRLAIPNSISFYCGNDIEDAEIAITKYAGEEPLGSLALNFRHPRDNSLLTLFISRDPLLHGGKTKDSIIVPGRDEPLTIDRVPRADVNAMVLGLALGQPIQDREGLENIKPFSGLTYDVLVDSLRRTADVWWSHVVHNFDGDRRNLSWHFKSTADGETLERCTFIYEAGADNRPIMIDINPQQGLALNFYRQDPEQGKQPMLPDTGDIARLLEVITELGREYTIPEVIPFEPARFSDNGVLKDIIANPSFDEDNPDLGL